MAAILFQSECINSSVWAVQNFQHVCFQQEHILLLTVTKFSSMNDKNLSSEAFECRAVSSLSLCFMAIDYIMNCSIDRNDWFYGC